MAMSAEHRSKFLEWEDKQTNKEVVMDSLRRIIVITPTNVFGMCFFIGEFLS